MENSIKMSINIISSKCFDETCTIHIADDNIQIMMGNKKQMKSLKNFLIPFCKNMKKD